MISRVIMEMAMCMYLYRNIGVFRLKYLMSLLINFAPGVYTMLLRRILVAIILAVGVPTGPG